MLLDTDGFLTEGPGWNILLVKNGEILSPESRNILLGVSRATLFEIARDEGIPMRETNLGRYEALTADEIFCSATSFGAVHAASFEGQPIGDGQPGPILTRIREAWKKRIGLDFMAQAEKYANQLPDWEAAALKAAQG
ncbi:MAG: aminotransferase class IV [Planctomycetaceae bacterium]